MEASLNVYRCICADDFTAAADRQSRRRTLADNFGWRK
jgi:hypothetical protein